MRWLRRLWNALTTPGEVPLRRYLAVALLARLPAVVWSRGFEFVDHQFQYVDPAWHVGLGGSWWQPHDYTEGIRSWAYPEALGLLFRLLAALGLRDPEVVMVATRFVHALLSLLPVAAFWLVVVRWQGLRGQRPLLWFFALNGFAVYSGVQTNGPACAVGLSATALLLFEGRHRMWPLASGLLLGLAFCCRFQDALFGFVLLAFGLLQRRGQACALLALGGGLMLLVQGLIDLQTYGWFLHSPLAYLHSNMVRGLALEFGTKSWWYLLACTAAALLLVPPFLRSGLRALWLGSQRFPILATAGLAYIAAHSLVPRKALRFVIVALLLLSVVQAAGLLAASAATTGPQRWHRRIWFALHALLLVVASAWYFNRGPVEAAKWLGRQPDLGPRLVLLDVGQEHLGGHFYLQRKELQIVYRWRQELPQWLAATRPRPPLYFLACAEPLADLQPAGGFELVEVARFSDWPDLRNEHRRFVYRLHDRD